MNRETDNLDGAQAPGAAPTLATSTSRVGSGAANGFIDECRRTIALGLPLVATQLAFILANTTDVVMMGWIGADAIAAGALAHSLFFPALIAGFGLTSAAAALLAQAVGADDAVAVRRTTRQAVWVALSLGLPLALALQFVEPLFLALEMPPNLAAGAQVYLSAAAWLYPSAFVYFVLRHLTSAHGQTMIVLYVTLAGAGLNALGNYALMFGNFGFPAWGLFGAGVTTSVVFAFQAGLMLAFVAWRREYSGYALFQRFWRPDWARFFAVWRLGAPIALMNLAEAGLFSAAIILMGWIGPDSVAAHAVSLQLAAIAFMAPLGLSQAATLRVGLAVGRRDPVGASRAGWANMALAAVVMATSATLMWLSPRFLTSLFLDPADPANAAAIELAVTFIAVAAAFAIFDGVQVAAAGALRGLNDTATPMVVAVFAYWGVGAPTAYVLAFWADFEGIGVWMGLAAGLAVAAVLLPARFWIMLRRMETERPEDHGARAAADLA